MMQTITHHDAVASLSEARSATGAAHAAGIRVQMHQLVQQRVIAGTVANATLALLGIAPCGTGSSSARRCRSPSCSAPTTRNMHNRTLPGSSWPR
jgi:hypothetical protein